MATMTGSVITDLNTGGGGGGAVSDVNGTGGVIVSPTTGHVVVDGNRIAAGWTRGITRVYAIDGVNGNDSNVGYADPATSSAADYAVACAAAGAAAKKTFAGLAAIFPRFGAGRLVEIVIANGGVNTVKSYGEALDTILNGVQGYAPNCPLVRGTGTNTTAGCVAFDGSANDCVYQGAITVSGLNVSGYNPTGAATTTSVQCTKVGGGAPAFPAEPAEPLGWRIRFDANTTTVALRNICRQICQVTTDTLYTQTALPATPATGDVFYIERPGWEYAASTISGCGLGSATSNSSGAQITGGLCNGNLILVDSHFYLAFGGNAGTLGGLGISILGSTQTYVHPARGSVTVGGGHVCNSSLISSYALSGTGLVHRTANLNPFFIQQLTFGAGAYAATSLSIQSCNFVAAEGGTGVSPQIGTTAALAAPRAKRISIDSSTLSIGFIALEQSAATAAIVVRGQCRVSFVRGVCSGSAGNTDVGMDLTGARGSTIVVDTTAGIPTVTGSLGDVRLAGGLIVTWAQAIKGVVDIAGNRIIAVNNAAATTAARIPWRKLPFSGSIVGSGGAVVSYLPDAGPLPANQTIPLRRPLSACVMRALRVTVLNDTSVNAVTVTLYKNGAATAMQVSIPAGTVANTKFVDTAHPIFFDDGDDYDLRMDDAADAGGAVTVSGTLEYC